MTSHQRRVRELEALRRLVADLESQVATTPGAIPATAIAAVFEQHTSLLPANSQLRRQLAQLALKLRDGSSNVIAESRLRRVVVTLRQKADDFGAWVEARDRRLSARR